MSSPVPFSLANKKLVSSLYRQSLRTAQNWINRKDFYRKKAAEIRGRFEANKHIEDPNQLKVVLDQAQALLKEYAHPDPIIPPCRPGGTKYERNLPPRKEKLVPFL